jgi:hypothetical protein
MKQLSLETLTKQMRASARQMVPWSYPRVDAFYEEYIYPLRIREATVDGYPVILYFGIADHGHHILETAQIFGKNTPFLPFYLVVKVARAFLGRDDLSLIEQHRGVRKIYCWTVYRDQDGNTVPAPFKMPVEKCVFEGFEYSYMMPQIAK